ncbi:MAG TPA: hypothetical protein PKA06_05795 [Gemmatales bacterium]|nr:hypothetical protein [Gemmatales bacterium]HMP16499.1 hypothetical protein [Gemmatales bacterium]
MDYSSPNEPMPKFRVDFQPMELPFTCTISSERNFLATATVLNAGYVMVDPESRQAICIVTSQENELEPTDRE